MIILDLIAFLLFLIALAGVVLIFQGVRVMAVLDEILASQAAIATALQAIADQKAASLTPEQAALVLSNELANQAAATALITP